MREILAQALALRALSRRPLALGLLAIAFATLAMVRAPQLVSDPDVFWLAATGRDIVRSGHFPRVNAYSFVDGNHPWVTHEGLFAVVYSVGLELLGPAFVGLLVLVSASCLYALALHVLASRGRTLAGTALGGILVFTCEPAFLEPRPGYVSLIFVLAMIALTMDRAPSLWRGAAVVLLEVVWTQAHGSFPLGVALIGVAAFEGGRSGRDRALWLLTGAIAATATIVNPYGLRLHGLVGRYLGGGDETARLIHSRVVEFFPLWRAMGTPFLDATSVVALATVTALAVHALSRRRLLARALFSLSLVLMACLQVRHVTVAILAGVLLLAPEVDSLVERLREDLPPVGTPSSFFLVPLPGLLAALAIWSSVMNVRNDNDWLATNLGGASLARLSLALPDHARVYVPFQPAAIVLWRAAERGVRVFFDPRNDCYSPEVARAGFDLEVADVPRARVEQVLGRYVPDFALVPKGHPVYDALASDPRWIAWQRDDAWTLFQLSRLAAP